MDCRDVSGEAYFKNLMKKAKAAHLKSKQEEGKKVSWLPSRIETILQFMPLSLHREFTKSLPFEIATTQLPAPYPPCVHSSDELDPTYIFDLTVETHNRGRQILLRVCTEVCRLNGLLMVVEDQHGTAIRLQLYHQPEETLIPVRQLLKQGTILLLKEPYLKRSMDESYVLRVDHVGDLIWLHGDDERIPFAWRPRIVEIDSAKARLHGNNHFKKNEWGSALQQYTRAIESAETPVDAQLAFVNRAIVNLQLGRPEAALNDAIAMNSKLRPTEKGVFREAKCLYELQNFDQCLSKLQELRSVYPNNKDVRAEIEKTTARLRECNDGIYDWQDMYQQASNTPPLIDCGTFSKIVEVKESPGKGRGLFTTKPVVAGELLICEKAFAYSHSGTGGATKQKMTVLLDFHTMRGMAGLQAQTLTQIVQKLYHEPATASSFLKLHHGDYVAQEMGLQADAMPVVDTFLVAQIMALNSFGAPTTSLELLKQQQVGELCREEEIMFDTNGIWCMASYINHSCVSNCCRSFIGDMMITRATEDLPAGTELKFSYRPLDSAESYEESQKKLAPWNFSCDCYLCEMKKKTPNTDMQHRQAHIRSLAQLLAKPGFVDMTRARLLLKQINKTYKKSGQKTLKLALQDGHHFVAKALLRQGRFVEAAPMMLRVLELGGFELAPRAANDNRNAALFEIQKWGPASEISWSAIIGLYRILLETAVKPFPPAQLTSMKAYAETTYAIMVGEKETFSSSMDM